MEKTPQRRNSALGYLAAFHAVPSIWVHCGRGRRRRKAPSESGLLNLMIGQRISQCEPGPCTRVPGYPRPRVQGRPATRVCAYGILVRVPRNTLASLGCPESPELEPLQGTALAGWRVVPGHDGSLR
eukprot:1077822-Rhodomonas_salina.1